MTVETSQRRTYGGWVRPKSFGLFNLGALGTVLFFGYLMIAVMAEAFGGIKAMFIWAVFGGIIIAPIAIKNKKTGRNGWQVIFTHMSWFQRRRLNKETMYLPGKIGPVPFGHQHTPLPGILATSALLEATGVHGQPFILIHLPRINHYTVLIKVEPDGSSLVDQTTIDTWVGHYDRWLANLAYEPNLVAATVTVETAPDPGHTLHAEVHRLLPAGRGPDLSKRVLTEAAAHYPSGSAGVTAHVALTYSATKATGAERELFALRSKDKSKPKVRSSGEMAAAIGNRLPAQLRALALTGVGAPRPMTADEVISYVRVAYDPTVAATIELCRVNGEPTGVSWETAGPTGSEEFWDHLQHDSGNSITWYMVGAPKGAVEERVLDDLLAPHDGIDRKRVTIIYRPHDPAEAPDIVDSGVRTAIGMATARKGEARAQATIALEAARQAAREEASGAGVTRFALLVTATTNGSHSLDEAAAAVDQLSRASRIQLRRAYGTQAAAFQQALGIGVIPTSHVAVPSVLRDKL